MNFFIVITSPLYYTKVVRIKILYYIRIKKESYLKGKKYTWTGDYPENFQFKAIQTVDGADIWAEGDNAKFDGKTYEYTFTFKAPAAE